MKFEWDENKNKLNLQKHGIAFEDAKMIFDDPLGSGLNLCFSYTRFHCLWFGVQGMTWITQNIQNMFWTPKQQI